MTLALNVPSKAQVWLVGVELKLDVFAAGIRSNFRTIKVQLETDVVSPCHTDVTPNIRRDFGLHLEKVVMETVSSSSSAVLEKSKSGRGVGVGFRQYLVNINFKLIDKLKDKQIKYNI